MEIKDYNVVINGKNFIHQTANNVMRTYDDIQKIVTGQGHNYTTGCLLDYFQLKKCYKMPVKDLSK